jgi:tetratricopeptide (TPR) repeat protein
MMTILTIMRRGGRAMAWAGLLVGATLALAQPAPDSSAARPAAPEELSQSELLKAYLQVRDQLHATQLAVLNNRMESEAASRAQAAALTERLEAIKVAMDAERERQRKEVERAEADRLRLQQEAEQSNRIVLWVAAAFGGIGLVAMLATPLFQWRAIKRLADQNSSRGALALTPRASLTTGDALAQADQAVVQSNQRLLTVIDRLERRVIELEDTAAVPAVPTPGSALATPGANAVASPVKPGPETVAAPVMPPPAAAPVRAEPVTIRRTLPTDDPKAPIEGLLARARGLLASQRYKEAVACYDEVLQLDVNHAEALLRKGTALERLKRDQEALRCYDRAIASNRRLTRAYLYKGGVCNRLGRYDEALESYELALQTEEDEGVVQTLRPKAESSN